MSAVPADTADNKGVDRQADAAAPQLPEPLRFTTQWSGRFNGETVAYLAVAGETYLRDEKSAPAASLFSVAYLRTDAENDVSRPVMFLFNGGPGSSTQWLHVGAFGPKRVVVPGDAESAGAPPYLVVDNDASILDSCDLVFIDPVGTGYSHALGARQAKAYWGLREDARSVADFIEIWITEHRRWNSPKYLAGESYGTTRAALVADLLSQRYIALNGVVLISAVLDFQNSRPREGDAGILAYASFLPTYAAIAWYHGKVERDGRTLQAFLDEARVFARTDYAQALIANNRLGRAERAQIVSSVAAFTGLKESYVSQSHLRIRVDRFFKELLRDQGVVVGRLDGRYTNVEPDSAGESQESDPAVDAIAAAFTAAMNAQLAELGVRMPRPYVAMKLIEEWNWLLEDKAPTGGSYINVVPHLGRAMRHNADLRVLVASGYYDLATPFFGAENALAQDGLVHERICYRYYEVGHMLFLHEPSRLQFLHDVRQFVHDGARNASAARRRGTQ